MELYRIWRILVANKWLLIWLPIVATSVGVALAYVLPEQYKSTALVLVRPTEELKFDSSVAERQVLDFPLGRSAPLDAPSKTYMELIKSPAVAERIVEALHLDVKPSLEGESAFTVFKERFKDWVADVARSATNYFKYGRDIPATPFDRAVEQVELKLEASVRKDTYAFDISYQSSDANRSAAVANMAAQIFIENTAAAYRSEAARAREFIGARLAESVKALDQARASVLSFKNSGQTFDPVSEYDAKLKNVSDLQNTLAKAVGKLAGLKREYEPNSPEVLGQESENAALQQQISTFQAELVDLPAKEARVNADKLTLRLAEESYEFFRKRFEEARVKESANVTEIRIVSPAEPSLYPSKPLKYIYGGVSFAVALVAAIGWALFAEQLIPRIRTLRDLEDERGVPVIGAVPNFRVIS